MNTKVVKVRTRTDMAGASSLKYVKVQTNKYSFPRRGVFWDEKSDLNIHCPFCDAVTVIPVDDEPIVTGCEHLDPDDAITPDHDGFSVWFRSNGNND